MNFLNKLLGATGRYDMAMESAEEVANSASISNTSVVLTGPLSAVYTQALDEVLAKDALGTGDLGDPAAAAEPAGETGTNVAAGEDAAQPGQVVEPHEEGKTTEVDPDATADTSAGKSDAVDDGDEPLNKDEVSEEVKGIVLESNSVSNEGIAGAVLGGLAGLFVGTGPVVGAALAHTVAKQKKEIEHLSKELEKAIHDNGAAAIKEGKIDAEDFKKKVDIGARHIIRGLIYGTFLGPFYTAFKGSEVEDLAKELDRKCKALNRIMEKAKEAEKAKKEVKSVVMESQAQDAILLQSLHSSLIPQAPTDEEFETVYAVDQTQVNADDVTEVTELLKNSENPETVTVLIDTEVADNQVAMVEAPDCNSDCRPLTPDAVVEEGTASVSETDTAASADERVVNPVATALESIVVALGGKVVHSFGEYLASRKR